MPKVELDAGPYEFHVYSNELNEPPHIHVRRDRNQAKFWLDPVELVRQGRFPPHEVRKIQKLVEEHREALLAAWNEYFNG